MAGNPRVSLLLAIVGWLSAGQVVAAQEAKKPNIVIILADDLGFSDIGCYGGEIATPHVDGLARRGVRFTQYYTGARCCPSRASLLTGLYPHQAGVGHMVDAYAAKQRERLGSAAYTDRLSPHVPTLAELLRAAGYRTLMVGKWHLGYRPEEWPSARGFDRSFALIEGAMNYYGHGMQHTRKRADPPMELDGRPFAPPRDGFFATDGFTDHALGFIHEQPRRDGPFFLYLAYNAPHWPLHAHAADVAKYRGKFADGWDRLAERRHERLRDLGIVPDKSARAPRPAAVPAWDALTPNERSYWQERFEVYAAQVEALDRSVGRVLAALRDTGADENTVVIFLSDNGGAAERPLLSEDGALLGSRTSYEGYGIHWAWLSCCPFRLFKRYVHEGGVSSPFIVAWPSGIPHERRGKLVHAPAHLIDLAPTCLAWAKAKRPAEWNGRVAPPFEGVRLQDALRAGEIQRDSPLFWEHEGNRAVRQGNWKLVAEHGKAWELYDLREDRAELKDLSASMPERVQAMESLYNAWAQRCGVQPWAKALGKERLP